MMNIYLVRHGTTGINEQKQKPNDDISAKGKEQARIVGEILKGVGIEYLLTSPYIRALSTAHEIGEICKLPVHQDHRLREINLWLNPEDLHDDTSEEYVAELSLLTHSEKKVQQLFSDLIVDHHNQTIAIVAHGNIIRAILTYALKMSLESIVRLQIDNASIQHLTYIDSRDTPYFKLISFNCTQHLKKG